LGSFLKITNYWAAYFHGKIYVLLRQKTGWATFWAIFFIHASGHPESETKGENTKLEGKKETKRRTKTLNNDIVKCCLEKSSFM
jgi:hypothetical protein